MRNQFFIFSIENSEMDNVKENNRALEILMRDSNIPYELVNGYYTHTDGKQVEERSYLVDAKFEMFVRDMAKLYLQESILFVDRKRNGVLYYLNGETERIGKFQKVDTSKNYTDYSIINGEIYSCS